MRLSAAMNVLVINVSRIGDTLLATPLIHVLSESLKEGTVDVVVHPGRKGVLKQLPFIRSLIAMTPKSIWWRRILWRQHYDVAIVLGSDPQLFKLARTRANYTVGFRQKDEKLNRLLDLAVEKPKQLVHAVDERLLLSEGLGLKAIDKRLQYQVSESESLFAKQWLTNQQAGAGPLIGLQMASFPTKSYRDWPFERFVELVSGLLLRWPEAKFVVLGDAHSAERAGKLSALYPGKILSAAGKLPLRRSAAIMSRLSMYIGVDTGPTHIAGALGIPMVSLYHCFHPGQFLAPLNHSYLEVVEHPALIARRESPMGEIPASLVLTAVDRLSQRLPAEHPMRSESE